MDKNTKDIYQYALGGVIVFGFFCLLGGLLVIAVPPSNEKSFDIMIGFLGAGVGAVIGYFFGSSKGSAEKNDIIAAQTDQKP